MEVNEPLTRRGWGQDFRPMRPLARGDRSRQVQSRTQTKSFDPIAA